ncbi:MAG: DEAD/DEAH box helicase [Rectinemataceae bacterium]
MQATRNTAMPIVWKNDKGAWYLADLSLRKPRYWITDEEGQRWFHARDLKRGHQMTQAEVDELGKSIRLSLVFDLPALSLPFDLRPAGTRSGKPVTDDPPLQKQVISRIASTKPLDPRAERQNRYDKLRRNLKPLYTWQEAAHSAWRDAGRIGVVEAVTGSGKTRLAFEAIAEGCLDNYRVLVLVPTMPLLEIWISELKAGFGESLRVGRFDGSIHDSFLDKDVIVARAGSAFQNSIGDLGDEGKTILIADEVQHFGDPVLAKALVDGFSWRLSLTATFCRKDDRVLKALLPWFKGLCYSYSRKEAVEDNILTRYELTWLRTRFPPGLQEGHDNLGKRLEDAKRDLLELHGFTENPFTEFLAELQRAGGDVTDPAHSAATEYLSCFSEVRRMLSEFHRKYEALAALEEWFERSDRSLVFGLTLSCAEESARIIDKLGFPVRLVHPALGGDDRSYALSEFRQGTVKTLCVPLVPDEGIDVPAADFALIMAANLSERLFIQRIGRVLRKKKEGRSARIVIMYVEGTIEDPSRPSADTVYGDIAEGSDALRYLDFDGDSLVKRQAVIKSSRPSPAKDQIHKAPTAILLKASRQVDPATRSDADPGLPPNLRIELGSRDDP